MVDSRSLHRIVALVMPAPMGGEESEDAHTHDLVMPGFRFHPTEEELIEFYLRRKVEGKHFNIELIASLDLYRYDPWELPALAAIGEKELFFYVPRDRKYRSGDRPNRVTPSGYWKATGADRMVRVENNRSIGLKKTLVFYSGKAPKGIRTSWIMNEYRLPHSETEKFDKQVEISLCRVYKRSGIDDHRQINLTPTTKASTSRATAPDKKPIVKATHQGASQPFIQKSNPKTDQLHGNKTNHLSGGLFCSSVSVASLSSTTSTEEDGNTSSLVPPQAILNLTPLDELSRVIGYNQTSYSNQQNQFVPMVPQSQMFTLNSPQPGSLSSISDKLWDWNDYTGFK
ncbi:hypothetical protein LUZ62_060366 [Rhynchospora pubera]|uniref:NAC domain-containing protein n=1 Tax=Rhynchospora pubera TaxID=906938 RepID=A0AAV8E9T8_9POAL|nr:hypothetical protein LUZ62_060366 [Rhynchospora pubera]